MMITRRTLMCIGVLLAAVLIHVWPASGDDDAHFADGDAPGPLLLQESIPFQTKRTDGNALGFVISNYAFFGDNFVTRAPSMEYPLGSQQEHLVRAGLWVGAINADGDTVVSTGSVSGYAGVSSASASEYTPRERMKERSVLITSRSYSRKAVSDRSPAGIVSLELQVRRGFRDRKFHDQE